MYIFKTYLGKYLYTYNIAHVWVYIILNKQISINYKKWNNKKPVQL